MLFLLLSFFISALHLYTCALLIYLFVSIAYVELPDGKVLSGTEWGNLLLWDGGFIKVELAKKGKKLCHNVRQLNNNVSHVTYSTAYREIFVSLKI